MHLFILSGPELFPIEEISSLVYTPKRAAARYSSDVLQMFYGPINISLPPLLAEESTISEAFQNLPPELHEIIYKEYLAIKMRQRAAMGWDEVHQAIQEAPFCEARAQIVKVLFCHFSCRRNYIIADLHLILNFYLHFEKLHSQLT